MDRFESRGFKAMYTEYLNLHSNMDRFERLYNSYEPLYYRNLHSNMDRFERYGDVSKIEIKPRIYIPIWIDLKGKLYTAIIKISL